MGSLAALGLTSPGIYREQQAKAMSCLEEHLVDFCFLQRDAKPYTCKMGNTTPSQLQPSAMDPVQSSGSRSECGIKRRLLASKVHQRPESLWTPKPMLRAQAKGSQGDTLTRSQSCCKRSSVSCFSGECSVLVLGEVIGWLVLLQ
ncbi:hypothetical protein DNTS_033282 [Danionella cerebrum]|uniref:Uncharacterized protein n=1 Tax=Danionella cerebrum TaxID=2873325 RepID=A0A553R2M4_9TELE|nr:hypothetical protein DNTS_033282 [Danionella translucida]